MTVSCPECRSVFRVDPAKVPATGVRARCSVCGGVIAIAGGTLPVSVTPASTGTVQAATMSSPRGPATPTPRPYTPAAPKPSVASAGATMTPPAPARTSPFAFRRPTPVHTTAHHSPVPTEPSRDSAPTAVATPAMEIPAHTTSTSTPRRAINPFLNADPSQRSRRLARALVSDLVAYHPQKREEGLREGTLRQLFREDIKKSYEEYVDQVGRDVAEGSPHFQDALNEILGAGRKLF